MPLNTPVPPPRTIHPGGGTGTATRVALSPDADRLATGSPDGGVRVWDLASGAPIWAAHHAVTAADRLRAVGGILGLAWSRDVVASCSLDREVRLWDASTGAERGRLGVPTGPVSTVAWSPDGVSLAAAPADDTVRVWDTRTGLERLRLDARARVRCLAWSPDGASLAGGGQDNAIRVWDTTTGALRATLRGHTHWVLSLSWGAAGLVSGGNDPGVRIWDLAAARVDRVLPTPRAWVLAVSPDGARLATGWRTLQVWDIASGELLSEEVFPDDAPRSLAWTPNGGLVCGNGWDVVRVWEGRL